MKARHVAILCAVSAVVGAYVANRYYPSIKESVVTQTRVVTVTQTRELPDGTKESTTTTTDNSTETAKKTAVLKQAYWMLTVGMDSSRAYNGSVNRRILGPVFLGATASSNGTLGVQVGFEF